MLHGPQPPHAAGSGADQMGCGLRFGAGVGGEKRRQPRGGGHPARDGQAQDQDRGPRGRALRRADGPHNRRAVLPGGSAHGQGRPRRAPPHGGHDPLPAAPGLLLRPPALQPRPEAAQRGAAGHGGQRLADRDAGSLGRATGGGGRGADAPPQGVHREALRCGGGDLPGDRGRLGAAAGALRAQRDRRGRRAEQPGRAARFPGDRPAQANHLRGRAQGRDAAHRGGPRGARLRLPGATAHGGAVAAAVRALRDARRAGRVAGADAGRRDE